MSYYDTSDLYCAICSYGSSDVSKLIELCNKYGISPYDIIENLREYLDGIPTTNDLFYGLFQVRIHNLQLICIKAIEKANEDNKANLKLLLEFLQEDAYYKIHINAMCSCFNNELLTNLDCVNNEDDLLKYVDKKSDFYIL
jgi:hypothetical protein